MTTETQGECTVIVNTERRVLQVEPKAHGRVVVTALDKATGFPYKLSIGYDELEALAHALLMYKSQPGRQEDYKAFLAEREFVQQQAVENEWFDNQYRYGSDD